MRGAYGHQVIVCTLTTGATFSTVVTLPMGYNNYAIAAGTFSVGLPTATANVYVQVSNTTTTSTFQRVKLSGVYSGGSGILDFEIPSSIGNYIAIAPCLAQGWKYARLEPSTVPTALQSFQIHAMM
jgi:hypothetical protein